MVNILLIMVNIWAIIWLMMVNNPFFRWILPEADGTMRRWPAATSLGETIAINCRFRHQWQLQGHLYFVGAHDCKRLNPLQFASNRFVFLVQVFIQVTERFQRCLSNHLIPFPVSKTPNMGPLKIHRKGMLV